MPWRVELACLKLKKKCLQRSFKFRSIIEGKKRDLRKCRIILLKSKLVPLHSTSSFTDISFLVSIKQTC